MHSDIDRSDHNGVNKPEELLQPATSFSVPNRLARRSFLRNLGVGAALLAPGAALLSNASKALAANGDHRASAAKGKQKHNDALSRGDVAILQLLAAAELIEADLWQQYNELGGVKCARFRL